MAAYNKCYYMLNILALLLVLTLSVDLFAMSLPIV